MKRSRLVPPARCCQSPAFLYAAMALSVACTDACAEVRARAGGRSGDAAPPGASPDELVALSRRWIDALSDGRGEGGGWSMENAQVRFGDCVAVVTYDVAERLDGGRPGMLRFRTTDTYRGAPRAWRLIASHRVMLRAEGGTTTAGRRRGGIERRARGASGRGR